MTAVEYTIARVVHTLEEAAKTRPLTTKEMQFLARMRALMRRLKMEERK